MSEALVQRGPLLRALALFFIMLRLIGCEVNSRALYDKLWHCQASGPADQCGTTESGQPMTCFGASALGGEDFCTEACDPQSTRRTGQSDSEYECLASGARLKICDPGDATSCPGGFACYRTSLNPLTIEEPEVQGLCMVMPVCNDDSDCQNPERPNCLSGVVRSISESKFIHVDHLYCGRKCETQADCLGDEQCAVDYFGEKNAIPPLCLPSCDQRLGCPPNFYCQKQGGAAYPDRCAPGMPGWRCVNDEDCVIGHCHETGAGFSICTFKCDSDVLCDQLSGPLGASYCANNLCVTRPAFAGPFCATAADCPEGICSSFNPYVPEQPREQKSRECHRLCTGPGSCAPVAGVPYLCMKAPKEYGECYPADFGLPCAQGVEDCMAQLECLKPEPANGGEGNSAQLEEPARCTIGCQADADCDHGFSRNGYCERGICWRQKGTGDKCNRSGECLGRICNASQACQ